MIYVSDSWLGSLLIAIKSMRWSHRPVMRLRNQRSIWCPVHLLVHLTAEIQPDSSRYQFAFWDVVSCISALWK